METAIELPAPVWGLKWWRPNCAAKAAFGARLIDTRSERMSMLWDRKSLQLHLPLPPDLAVAQERILTGGIDTFWQVCKKMLIKNYRSVN